MSFRIPYLKRIERGLPEFLQDREASTVLPPSVVAQKGEEVGIEIRCPVCGLYSGGRYETPRVPLEVLRSSEGYKCGCGTVYRVGIQDSHLHLFMKIPKEKLND